MNSGKYAVADRAMGPRSAHQCAYIYVMSDREISKIGYSRSLDERLRTLRFERKRDLKLAYCLLVSRNSALAIEALAHHLLCDFALGRECFSVDSDHARRAVEEAACLHQAGVLPPAPAPVQAYSMVVPSAFLRRVDDWRAGQYPIPSRSAALRQLLDEALGDFTGPFGDGLTPLAEPRTTAVSPAPLERVDVSAGGSQRRQ